ncbi:MAG: NAD(P)/FAD-dependent oxidoreductase [Chitinophagaceae bacterium]
MSKKLIVIGGGAAGFFCAVNAARMNTELTVILLEKTSKLLSKVKISGGGRCNVTHHCSSIAEMTKKYPRGGNFIKKCFHHFFTTDTIHWFNERNVLLKTEEDGRMFPVTDSSQTIIDCLSREGNKYGVEIMMNAEVKQIKYVEEKFEVLLADSRHIHADFICVACGGYPKSILFQWLTNLQHTIEDPVPSLFTFNIPGNSITKLMGVAIEGVTVRISGTKLEESGPLLITHWGMSGPAILKLSAWGARELAARNYYFKVIINWLPLFNEQTLKEKMQQLRFDLATQKIVNRNPFKLPQRLWEHFIIESGINPDIRWADLPVKEQNKLIKNLCLSEFDVQGKTTFKEEFVTAGGISLNEVDPSTMMSKIVPNLFFAGEVLNIDGVTGGFNFQNAWTTGHIAAKAISTEE